MATNTALVTVAGRTQQIQTGNTLGVGDVGITTSANNLLLSAAGAAVSVASGKNLIAVGGGSSFDFSVASGTFATPTGVATFNGSTNTFTNVLNANGGVQRSGAAASLDIGTGASTTTVNLSQAGQNVVVGGNLIVNGTTTTTHSDTVLIDDNHLYLNNGYTAVAAQTGGLVINRLPTATATTVNAAYVAGVAAVSNPTVGTVGAATFAAGDLIQFSSSANNSGLYEVLSHAANVLTIRGVGVTSTVEDFTQNQFVAEASDGATITKVNVAVIRNNSGGTAFEVGFGAVTPIVFTTLASATSVTLQQAYENGNTIVTAVAEGPFSVTGTETITLTGGAASSLTTTAGALTITSAAAATWSTAAGALTVNAAATLGLGLNAGSVVTVGETLAGTTSTLTLNAILQNSLISIQGSTVNTLVLSNATNHRIVPKDSTGVGRAVSTIAGAGAVTLGGGNVRITGGLAGAASGGSPGGVGGGGLGTGGAGGAGGAAAGETGGAGGVAQYIGGNGGVSAGAGGAGVGGAALFQSGAGGAASATGAAAVGGNSSFSAASGGAGSGANPGAAAGAIVLGNNDGGAGVAGAAAGPGGGTTINGGAGGTNGGGGGAAGGSVSMVGGAGTGAAANGSLFIGTSTTTAISVGATAVTGTILLAALNISVLGGTAVGVGGTTTVAGGSGAATFAGGQSSINGGVAGAASGATAGGVGGATVLGLSIGGAAAGGAGTAGAGGLTQLSGGLGGAGSATGVAGAGGNLLAFGGNAGADGGAGGANGGNFDITGGLATGAGVNGSVNIGTAQTQAITIGLSTKTATFQGSVTIPATSSADRLTLNSVPYIFPSAIGTVGQVLGIATVATPNVLSWQTATGSGPTITGQTTTGLADGDFGYVSAANTWTKAKGDGTATEATCIAINEGVVGTMATSSSVIENAKFTTAGGSPAHGAEVFLAAAADDGATGAGKATATAPTTVGQFLTIVGVCVDNANYAGAKTAKIIFHPYSPILL